MRAIGLDAPRDQICPWQIPVNDKYLTLTSLAYLQRARKFSKQIWLLLWRTCYKRVCAENLLGLKVKMEQEHAVLVLLEKKDVFAVLPTDFGKSLIYQRNFKITWQAYTDSYLRDIWTYLIYAIKRRDPNKRRPRINAGVKISNF